MTPLRLIPSKPSQRPSATSGPTEPPKPADRTTAASPGPWLCAASTFDWDRGRDIAACKVLCARCTTRGECADLWLTGSPAEQRYGVGVWAGFDMSDSTDRRAFRRWAGLS